MGWLGESLIKELPAFPTLRLAAVQDTNADLAGEVARRYGDPWVAPTYGSLLAREDVQAVVICTPNTFHARQAMVALAAGKHVLVQKPLALSAAASGEVLRAAAEHHKVLFVDYSYRFLATMKALRAAVREAGPIQSISAAFHNIYGPGKPWFFDRALSGGGALMDLGVHLIDLALDVVAPQTATVTGARMGFDRGFAVEDFARVELRLDGVPVGVEASWQAEQPFTDISFAVRCQACTVEWRNVEGSFFHFRSERDGVCLLDRETTLRGDTLAAFRSALRTKHPEPPDIRVYSLLEEAYRAAVR